MHLKVEYLCHPGKVREHNEDGILVHLRFIRDERGGEEIEVGDSPVTVAVADGVGGAEAGEVASEFVLRTLAGTPARSVEEVIEVLRACQKELKVHARSFPEKVQMASTVAGIVFQEGKGIVFNVGDSRVYRERFGYLVRVSKDHSVVERLVEAGVISPEETRNHPQRHIITSAIGVEDGDFEVFVREIPISVGDRFLICSDGLWEMLSEEEMEACLRSEEPLSSYFERAMERGGMDNISIVLVRVCE
jgi:protein phosphatase